ncbi:oligosaccharide repeat unit polymerase [Lelliottia nimipressuralis]|jgi:hypothetical protein|uniref:oligosaccharide repeat unit polymerase n=1 Tax=Lelliottia nimipressuralis TaxID=69220 RepID=UPI003D2CCDCD
MYERDLRTKILTLFLSCESLCFIYIAYNNELVSDYIGKPLGSGILTLSSVFFVLVFFYMLFHFIWNASERIFIPKRTIGSVGNLNVFILILITLYFLLNLKTGVGKVGGEDIVKLTGIDKLLFIAPIFFKLNFLIYIYAAGNRNKTKLYYFNLLFFSFVELTRGVSFTILLLVIIEFYKFRKLMTLRYFLLSMVLGIALVNIIYNLKFYIRMGPKYEYIDIYTSLIMLMGRLSILSNFIFIFDNISDIRSYFHTVGYQGVDKEFLESLTPIPSLFGINEKVMEFGKILFSYSNVTFTSATAASLLGIMYVYPDSILSVLIIISTSWIYIHIVTSYLEFIRMQRVVGYFFILLSLYQGFFAILGNYLYALTIYFVIAACRNLLLSRKNETI